MRGDPHVLTGRSEAALLDEVHALLDRVWQAAPEVPPADRMAFTTAVAEVAANVVEHAAAGRLVDVRVEVQAADGALQAVLEDGGIPFTAGAGDDDPLAETGRGLTMARALCEVSYERDGELNRWRLVRPVAALAAARRTVLVVDDDEMIRALLQAGLTDAGYEVLVAETGAQALDLLTTSLPDVVVSDVNMPEMDGFALVRAVRARPELRRVPLIFLTSRAETDDVVNGLRLGADDYLSKPFRLPELVARVEAKALRVPVPLEDLAPAPAPVLLPAAALTGAVTRERERAAWSGRSGAVAVLGVEGLEEVRDQLGRRGVERVRVLLEDALRSLLADAEAAGLLSDGRFALLLPHVDADAVPARLLEVQGALTAAAAAEPLDDDARVTVVSGWALLTDGADADDVLQRAGAALEQARRSPERSPVRSDAPVSAAAVRPVDDDLQRAAQVQRSLLPQRPPVLPGYDVAGTCLPTAEVGGDFFDWYDVPGGVALTLADAMGKGMGAAIVTATVRAVLRAGAAQTDLAGAVGQAAATLESDLEQTATFVTLFHGRLDAGSGRLRYVDAGHGLTYLVRADGSVLRAPVRGLPVGAMPDTQWAVGELDVAPGETLLVVSDGVLDLYGDAADPAGEALRALVQRTSTAREVVDGIAQEARSSGLQADDVTVVVVRRAS